MFACLYVRETVIAFVIKIITILCNCAIQDVIPSSSCSLGRAGTVKDFKWLNHASAAYVVLSNGGLLSHGSLGEGLKDVMENVDAGSCLFLILFIPTAFIFEVHIINCCYEFY